MFFAADRVIQQRKRRKSEETRIDQKLDEGNSTLMGETIRMRYTPSSLESLYPDFSSRNVDELVKTIPEEEQESRQPPQKKIRTTAMHVKPARSEPLYTRPAVESPKSKISTWEDLVKSFPHLMDIYREQQEKLNHGTIADEYIREIPKKIHLPEMAESKPFSVTNTIFQTATQATGGTTAPTQPQQKGILSVESSAKPQSASGGGGGLLSGIDDLFGGSNMKKKSTLKRR
jgi:hypothetical protein